VSESFGWIDVAQLVAQELLTVSCSGDKGECYIQTCCRVGGFGLYHQGDSLDSLFTVALEHFMKCPNRDGSYRAVVSISLVLLAAERLRDLVRLGYVLYDFTLGTSDGGGMMTVTLSSPSSASNSNS
jgi:hypothetical protein